MLRCDMERMRDAISRLLVEQQLPVDHANDVAESMVAASLRSLGTHGVHLLGLLDTFT